jgi:predicted alpha/beta-fold hydrolase
MAGEAESKSSLTCRLANAITPLGFNAVQFNFRSCSEEAPLLLSCKLYHAGLEEEVLALTRASAGQSIYVLGFSLGTNVLFNMLDNLSPVQTAEQLNRALSRLDRCPCRSFRLGASRHETEVSPVWFMRNGM